MDERRKQLPSSSSTFLSSGAGKTTLLNILAGRNSHDLTVEGSIRLNGNEAAPDFVCSVSGYIQQEDLFISTLTVREHLVFQVRVCSSWCA